MLWSGVNPGNTCSSHDGMVQTKSNPQRTLSSTQQVEPNPISLWQSTTRDSTCCAQVTRPSHRSSRWLHCVGICWHDLA